ncbi:MAG: peptidoglycan-binding domain-containing protein, partial [Acidimicrobiales bacterium]
MEGTEASLFVSAAASRSSWRRALVAVGAAAVTLVPVGLIIWVLFRYIGATYLDYAIAAVVLALGAREIREGLSERPAGAGAEDVGQEEAMGLAPASAASIRRFQQEHDLEPTGVVDEACRVAIRAARAEAGTAPPDPYVIGVDVADPDAVRT